MSIAILVSVHDGIVLASDSASSVMLTDPQGRRGVVTVYNNANKICNLVKGKPIGCIAFGSGSIGNASVATLLKDFRRKLTEEPRAVGFDPQQYTIEQVAQSLGDFLAAECRRAWPEGPKPFVGLFLAGYSSGENLGEAWAVKIVDGVAESPAILRKKEEVGINWGGEGEAIHRLVLGFSERLPEVLRQAMNLTDPAQQRPVLATLRSALQAPIVFSPMPIQDAIDLAEFLVHVAEAFSRFTPGAPTVGGPIEIAAITKHEHFKWIKRKHYYDVRLNRREAEPSERRM